MPVADLARLVAVERLCELPTAHPCFADVELLWESFTETRRHRDGDQHLPLSTGMGSHTFVEDLSRAELAPAVRLMTLLAQQADG